MRVTFGEWTPDNPSLSSGALEALNVYPRTSGSYGSLSGLSDISNALDAYCRGAFSGIKANDGSSYTFAGDAEKLYQLSGITFSDVSLSGGYSLGEYEAWEFLQFGESVIAASLDEDLQEYDLGTLPTTFTALSATAPKARHIGQVRDFVMVGNTYDATFGSRPNRVWWPAINDPSTWPTPATQAAYNVQSDFQDLPTGGQVTKVTSACGGVDGVIFSETAIHTAVYEGAPNIFRFYEADAARGTNVSGSVAHTGAFIAFLAEDGFYAFNGTSSTPIGNGKIDKWFYSKFAQQYSHRMKSVVDPINKLIIWGFPDGQAGSTPNCLLIFNWALGRWSHAEVTHEMLFRFRTSASSPDSWDAIYGSPDSMTESPDSRIFIGGKIMLSGFSTDHKLSHFTGDTLQAEISTSEFGDDSGARMFVSGIRPLVEGAAASVSISYRNDQADTITEKTAIAKGVNGICPQRQSARYFRAKVVIPAAATWSHAVGVEPLWAREGDR